MRLQSCFDIRADGGPRCRHHRRFRLRGRAGKAAARSRHHPTTASISRPTRSRPTARSSTAGGHVNYTAIAGTIVVHAKGWDDVPAAADKDDKEAQADAAKIPPPKHRCSTSPISRRAPTAEERPITFIFNGGPGSATVWLHMGAFGPKRVVTADDAHTPAAPYNVVEQRLRACSMPATSSSSTRRARASAASPARTRRRRSTASIQDGHAFADFIQHIPGEIRPLEFAEIPVRRKLRHAALGGSRQRAGDRTTTSTSTA